MDGILEADDELFVGTKYRGFELEVKEFQERDTYEGRFVREADEGMTLVVLTVQFTNPTEYEVTLPRLQGNSWDAYEVHGGGQVTHSETLPTRLASVSPFVNPGETLVEDLVFELPAEVDSYTFTVELTWPADNPLVATWELSS